MAYNLRYTLNFNIAQDVRQPNTYEACVLEIYEKDGTGDVVELLGTESPIIINYQNSSELILESLIGSQATLNFIATDGFTLEQLYTEDEFKWFVKIRRLNYQIKINWSLNETPEGEFVDFNLEILVNGVQVVNSFTNESGSFNINRGDLLTVKTYQYIPSGGYTGGNLEITGIATERRTTTPLSIAVDFYPNEDITIKAYSTWSDSEYTAIRSQVFYKQDGRPIVFTKSYTSSISQLAAQLLANADSLFESEGISYAESQPGYNAIWRGFIIPDGCQESFSFEPYIVSINAIDSIGMLKNLSYATNSGNLFIGKQSIIEVIFNCLGRTNVPEMDIYTCVNITHEDFPTDDEDDPLALTYVNAESYLKGDELTPMDCQEVLSSVLGMFTCVLVQSDGHWFIFRPNELALSDTLKFRRYVNGEFSEVVEIDTSKLLGGYTEGIQLAPLFHVHADQLKMIAKPYKNSSFKFTYGDKSFFTQLLDNPTFAGAISGCVGPPDDPCDNVIIPDWTMNGTVYAGLPLTGGIKLFDETPVNTANYYENDATIVIPYQYRLKLIVSYENPNPEQFTYMNFMIELTDGGDTYYMTTGGVWTESLGYYQEASSLGNSGQMIVSSEPAPTAGTIKVRIMQPTATLRPIILTQIKAGVYVDLGQEIGELHTAEQTAKFTYVPNSINVVNGDVPTDQYVGGLFKPDQSTLTESRWYRLYAPESALASPFAFTKPLLRLASEETVRMHQRPYVKFDGSIFGYFPPLSRFNINLLNGNFMPVSLTYDIQRNITRATLCSIANEEVEQNYTLIPDYGSTTKVTIDNTL